MKLTSVRETTYPVEMSALVDNAFEPLRNLLRERQSVLLTSPSVDRHFGGLIKRSMEGLESRYHVHPFSEQRKTLEDVQHLCALTYDLDRTSALVAIGGGVCTDMAGMTAALIRRGLDCIRVPTTLIGQIDAGIGLKCAVNYRGLKSRIGAFHPPAHVLVDPVILRTLPADHIRNGFAEIIKIAVVTSSELLDDVERNLEPLVANHFQQPVDAANRMIAESIRLMLEQLEMNPFEDQYQRLVDFGHTFSPLIEAAHGFNIHHSHAVAIDMSLSSTIGAMHGTISWEAVRRILELIQRAGLPTDCTTLTLELCEEAVASAQKHRGGTVNLVVPNGLGAGEFLDHISSLELEAALKTMREMNKGVAS